MFGPMGMAVGSVVLPSATEPSPTSHPLSSVSKANETNHTNNSSHKNSSVDASHIANAHEILRTDSITVSVSESTAAVTNDNMMTGTNLLVLPRANPSYDMAFFLKTTGPAQPRSPNKGGSPKRMASVPKSPLRFLKRRRPSENLTRTHERLNDALSADGQENNVSDDSRRKLSQNVVQKVSKNGTRYLQIAPAVDQINFLDHPLSLNPDIIESRVSVLIADQFSSDNFDDWIQTLGDQHLPVEEHLISKASTPVVLPEKPTVRILTRSDCQPVRPAASNPPTPLPDSGVVMAGGQAGFSTALPKPDSKTALTSHPPHTSQVPVPPPPPPAPTAKCKGDLLLREGLTDIVHPSPRRLHSHPVLLQRSSSDVSGLNWHRIPCSPRSISDSPGPPPPRSPLRVERNPSSIDTLLDGHGHLQRKLSGRSTSSTAILEKFTYKENRQLKDGLPPAVTITSHAANVPQKITPSPRLRFRRPQPAHVIDAVVKSPSPSTTAQPQRRRLRRARPGEPRPLDLSKMRSKVQVTEGKEQSYTPSIAESEAQSVQTLSRGLHGPRPMRSSHQTSNTHAPRAPRPLVVGRKSPAPRPRSAKVVPHNLRGLQTPPRPVSPVKRNSTLDPSLPSPPPKKDLPPTPKKVGHSASHSTTSANSYCPRPGMEPVSMNKALPTPPYRESIDGVMFPSPPSSAKTARSMQLLSSSVKSEISPLGLGTPQLLTKENTTSSNKSDKPTRLEARLEALERHNRLLEAALVAVLKTGGTLNGCPCHGGGHHVGHPALSGSEGSRGSVASRSSTASSGHGALEMYLSTRGKQ